MSDPIDPKTVAALAQVGCTDGMIRDFFGLAELPAELLPAIAQGRAAGKVLLLRQRAKVAMSGSVPMLAALAREEALGAIGAPAGDLTPAEADRQALDRLEDLYAKALGLGDVKAALSVQKEITATRGRMAQAALMGGEE